MSGYNKLETLLLDEIEQLFEEGKNINRDYFKKEVIESNNDKEKLLKIYTKLRHLSNKDSYIYIEPSKLEEIELESNISNIQDDIYNDIDFDYFYGAWLGRCIGCAWGQPVEGKTSEEIIKWYKNANKYPIKSYVPTISLDKRNEGLATDQKINRMPLDDDTRFTVLNYLLLKNKGLNFDSWDIGEHWLWNLPFRFVCTAETQAYLNFINLDSCTPWYKPKNAMEQLIDVNTYLNPYREYIGAQIRCDAFAYICAGKPLSASKLAYKDAYFSHTKNGIYGSMFFAALISSAFTVKDVNKCIDIALSVIPKKSRFYEMVNYAIKISKSNLNNDELIKEVLNWSKKYNWVHTLNNALICITAIIRHNNSFINALSFTIECGLDTDCNGATVGSFMGALLGEKEIPIHLKNPLNDTFSVGINPYNNYSIKEFSKELKDLHIKLSK